MFKFLKLWGLLLLLTGYSSLGQFRFDRIGTQQGLSQSSIFDIFQDHKGFIWIATADGLNKYDGHKFTVYRQDFNDSLSLSSNDITCITEDNEGSLWIGARIGGVNKFDKNTGQILRITQTKDGKNIKNINISGIVFDSKKNIIWASTFGLGLLQIEPNTNTANWYIKESQPLTTNDISLLFRDSKGRIWIGAKQGKLLMILENGKFREYKNQINDNVQKNQVLALLDDTDGKLLVGTRGNGLFTFDPKTAQFQLVHYNPVQIDKENIITALARDKNGDLWVGTDSGVLFFKDGDFTKKTHLQVNPDSDLGLNSHAIYSNFVDRDNNVWIGTWEAGLNVLYRNKSTFNTFSHRLNEPNSLLANKVTSIATKNDDETWIGSNIGISLLKRSTNKFTHFIYHPETSALLNNNDINTMMVDADGTFYACVWGVGLRVMKPNTNTYKFYDFERGKYGTNLTAVTSSKKFKTKIWAGTQGGHIVLFDKKTGIFEPLPEINQLGLTSGVHINSLLEDSDENLWIGTYSGGVYRYNLQNNTFIKYAQSSQKGSLSDNHVIKVFQDSQNKIWIATNGGGLNLYQPASNSFKVFTVKDGLMNNSVKAILEDSHQNLWLSTNAGISKFNIKNQTFKNYTEEDGIIGREFIINSASKNARGEMMFGSTSGLTIFHPDSLVQSKKVPNVYLTGLQISNRYVRAGEPNSPLKQDISETQSITLKANQSVFSIGYIALDFQKLKNNQYAYQLEGFDKDWVYVGTQLNATYTNLNAGEYTFKVKATNNDGVWNEKATELHITILPPWYKSNIAYFCYFLLILASIYALRRIIEIREKFKADIRLKELENQQVQQLDQLKTNFFTNISHEIRTPLTLIISPLEKFFLNNSLFPDKQKSQLASIHNNAQKLLKLINQLLDISKLEAGKITPVITKNDLVDHLNKIINSFEDLASQQQKILVFHKNEDTLLAYFDEDIIEKIVSNLLSNAFKYSKNGAEITVCLSTEIENNLEYAIIKVNDTGIGIAPKDLDQIFNRFYQVDSHSNQVGTGVGLSLCRELTELHKGKITVQSTLNKGSEFIVKLPIDNKAFENEWISEVDTNKSYWTILDDTVPKRKEVTEVADKQNSDAPILLIVEDNDELREYIREIFSDQYQIHEAENGKIGLEKALSLIPDIIISDWMMPEMNGIEFCESLKQNEKISHIPFVLLTSKGNNDSKAEGLEIGADDYVTKPFNANLLELRVKNLIENRRKLRSSFSKGIYLKPKDIAITASDEIFLQKTIAVIEENIANTNFDVEALEQAMDMSKMQLYRKLKSLTDLGGNEFIRNIRLKRAAQLLENDNLTIAEVAYKVGFNDPAYFTRMFKKEFGKVPSSRYSLDVL